MKMDGGEGAASPSNTSDSPGEGRRKPTPLAAYKAITGGPKASTIRNSIVKEVTTLISSVLQQQWWHHDLFLLKEDQHICGEMELEQESFKL